MKKKLLITVILASLSLPAAVQAGWVGDTAANVGDFLSSWGRDVPAQEVRGAAQPPAVVATGATGSDCNRRHKELADQNIQDRAALDDRMIQPSKKGVGEMSCFDKYKNFSLSGMFGFPSLDGLLGQLEQQACNYVDQQVNTATQPVNQSVWMPGGARVNTGVVFGSQAAGKGTVSGSTQSTGQFQLPQIFK